MRLCLLLCTEAGYLENTSKSLIASIRKFGGGLKDIPIYSYQPRKDKKVSKETLTFFEKRHVEYIDYELNKEYNHYPLANKPIICAHAEKNIDADILVFLDSDVFILGPPIEFWMPDDVDVMINPVYRKHIGTNGENDLNIDYWRNLYSSLGIQEFQYVNTIATGEKIIAYFNSGHIAVRSRKGIFSAWEYNFRRTMKKGLMPKHGLYFVEQSVLSASIAQLACKWNNFSENYNFHINLNILKKKMDSLPKFSRLISLHYHDLFKRIDSIDEIEPLLDSSDKANWIRHSIKEYGLMFDIERFKSKP